MSVSIAEPAQPALPAWSTVPVGYTHRGHLRVNTSQHCKNMNAQIYEGYVTEIVNALIAIPKKCDKQGNAAWTRKIKEDIGEIGKGHGFRVCPSAVEGDERQWLYDLIWYRNNSNIRLEAVPLVLESEWSMDNYEIRFDFEKLLLANSPIKVMVFQNCDGTSERVFDNLRCGIDDYAHGVSCVYVLACYQWEKKQFKINTFRKEPDKMVELEPKLSQ